MVVNTKEELAELIEAVRKAADGIPVEVSVGEMRISLQGGHPARPVEKKGKDKDAKTTPSDVLWAFGGHVEELRKYGTEGDGKL